MSTHGVWELSTERLEQLATYLAGRARPQALSAAELDDAGFRGAQVAGLAGMEGAAARVLVAALLAERARRPRLELVWSGPEGPGTRSRDTARVLAELFASAERSVVIAGFAFWNAHEIFEPLHARALLRRLHIEFFVHLDPTGESRAMTPEAFFRYTWPWTDVVPRVYRDARATEDATEVASMHAKCVVIDDTSALITSANFTGDAHDRNVELGVLIHDPPFASQVAQQWRALVARGLFEALDS